MNRTATSARGRFARLFSAPAALLLTAFGGCGGDKSPPADRTRTVVLISIDTLRPERLGVYGNSAEVSPTLDQFAKEAVVFEDALSVAPWTLPSHMTMLTGLDPIAHGVRWSSNRLSSKVETVAESLRARGFTTAAFADGGFVGPGWGFEDGFELFDSAHRGTDGATGFARYLTKACDWLRSRKDAPAFLFLHSFDVHAPYDECSPEVLTRFRKRPTPDGALDHELFKGEHTAIAKEMRLAQYQRISEALNDYDAGVHESDLAVAEVFRTLRELGRWDDALVIVTSDHGESFYDQRLWVGHGINLTDDEIKIPLMVKFPRGEGAGQRIATLVDLVDLAPTMLDAVQAPVGSELKGSSLRELVRGGKRSRSYAFGHTVNGERYFLVRGDLKYITGTTLRPFQIVRPHLDPANPAVFGELLSGSKFVRKLADGSERATEYSEAADPLSYADTVAVSPRLYDRRADPHELVDLAHTRTDDLRKLGEALARIQQESTRVAEALAESGTPREMTAAEQKGLAELGYLASGMSVEDEPGAVIDLHDEAGRPDMAPLYEQDQRVHRARIAVRAGTPLDAAQRAELGQCAEHVADWGEANTDFHFRAQWRLKEIEKLCTDGGAPFDAMPTLRRVAVAVAKSKSRQRATIDPELKQEIEAEREQRRRERQERKDKARADTDGDGEQGN